VWFKCRSRALFPLAAFRVLKVHQQGPVIIPRPPPRLLSLLLLSTYVDSTRYFTPDLFRTFFPSPSLISRALELAQIGQGRLHCSPPFPAERFLPFSLFFLFIWAGGSTKPATSREPRLIPSAPGHAVSVLLVYPEALFFFFLRTNVTRKAGICLGFNSPASPVS